MKVGYVVNALTLSAFTIQMMTGSAMTIEWFDGRWIFPVSRPKKQYLLFFVLKCVKKQRSIREKIKSTTRA